MLQDKIDHVYEIRRPAHTAWLVFDSPHSGREYPPDFNHNLSEDAMCAAEDSLVDDLYGSVPDQGGAFLRALFPRTYIDPNRDEDDIKEAMIADPENWPLGFNPTNRSEQGHGLIRETLYSKGAPLYKQPLKASNVMQRVAKYHRPYHQALQGLMDESLSAYGQAWHINCHSMPSSCVMKGRQMDFCLGDAFGQACSRTGFTKIVENILREMGYAVNTNFPFAGGKLVTDYADPENGIQSLQIEINKAIYWDENKNRPSRDYDRVKRDIATLSERLIAHTGQHIMRMAAD